MKIVNRIVAVGGRNWLIREAVSAEAAFNEIANARITGSVGSKTLVDETRLNNGRGIWVQADVVALNEDGTERRPS